MKRILLFLALVSALLLAACSPAQTVDRGLQTVAPTPTPTPTPTSTPIATPTEAPLTLAELGIPAGQEDFFSGVEGHINREVIDGEKVYTTTIFYHNGEQKEVKYIIEPGTFDAHTEIYDDLTRPLAVKAYRLDENGKKTEVTLLWQGPERGFREAFNLTAAYDPELKQVDQHPYLHIVHADKPINSIDDLPTDDERLTLLNSIRYEQAKAIRALQVIREKLQNGQDITAQDLQGSFFLRPLQEKLRQGEPITEDDLYVLFSPKAVEKWDAGGGLSLYFEFQKDGSKWVYLKSRGNSEPNQTHDSRPMKFLPYWFYTKDENGQTHHKLVIVALDADDVQRYKATQDPLDLQGKFIISENRYDVEISPNNTYWQDLYRQNNPNFPYLILHAEGGDYFTKTDEELIQEMTKKGIAPETQEKILSERSRLAYLLSLPDNKANQLEYVDGYVDLPVNIMAFINDPNKKIGDIAETVSFLQPIPPLLQLLELMFDVRISI